MSFMALRPLNGPLLHTPTQPRERGQTPHLNWLNLAPAQPLPPGSPPGFSQVVEGKGRNLMWPPLTLLWQHNIPLFF